MGNYPDPNLGNIMALDKEENIDYFDIIEKDVKDLYKQKKWDLSFVKRKGGYLNQDDLKKRQANTALSGQNG